MQHRRIIGLSGWSAFILGLLFYIFVRGYLVSPYLPLDSEPVHVNELVFDSFPSFIHAFAIVLLSVAYGLGQRFSVSVWIIVSCILEFIQPIFGLGIFDVQDLYASFLGIALACFLIGVVERIQAFQGNSWVTPQRVAHHALLFLGLSTSAASYYGPTHPPGDPSWPDRVPTPRDQSVCASCCAPVYLSYEDLRESFEAQEPRPAKSFGKILVLGEQLIVSEPNVGVHIFDNSDPAHPEAKYFLNIPGNVDLAARNDVLYADSFVDLLAIRLSGEKPELIRRENDVFEWRAYQVFQNAQFTFSEDPDRSLGVIVGAQAVEIEESSEPNTTPTSSSQSQSPAGRSQSADILNSKLNICSTIQSRGVSK